MAYQDLDEILDWDDEIDDGSSFILLDPGDYDFKVLDFKEGYTDKGIRKGIIDFEVSNGDQKTTVTEHFVLTKKAAWKIAELLRSVGLKKHGENVKASLMKRTPGLKGRCEIFIDEFVGKKGNTVKVNHIGRFYDPTDAPRDIEAEINGDQDDPFASL